MLRKVKFDLLEAMDHADMDGNISNDAEQHAERMVREGRRMLRLVEGGWHTCSWSDMGSAWEVRVREAYVRWTIEREVVGGGRKLCQAC